MILYALFYYETAGEYSSLFVANKIAFFFKRLKEPSFAKLTFVQDYYGPYSVGVDHLIKSLDGKYLKGMRQMTAKPFEKLELNYEKKQDCMNDIELFKELCLENNTYNKPKEFPNNHTKVKYFRSFGRSTSPTVIILNKTRLSVA